MTTVTTDMLREISDAFNRHDIDGIMAFFTEDAVFESPKGPDPWGRRFVGSDQVRDGIAARFVGLPDVHYGDASHWVSGDGASPNGRSPEPRPMASGSTFGGATSGLSATGRWRVRTRTGKSSPPEQAGTRGRADHDHLQASRRPISSPVPRLRSVLQDDQQLLGAAGAHAERGTRVNARIRNVALARPHAGPLERGGGRRHDAFVSSL